jgi:GNAT superfamily N-acetyltransferase
VNIVRLQEDKFDEFFNLVIKMVEEAEFKDATPSSDKLKKLFKVPNAIAFGALKDEKLIGFIAGIKHEHFFSTNQKVSDLGFYVLPEHRGCSAAIKLIRKLEGWTKDAGISDLCIGQTTAINIDKTKQFYERLGYQVVGFNTVKHLKE